MPQQSRTQQIQYKIKLALHSRGLIQDKHLHHACLCEYTRYNEHEDTVLFSKIKDFELENINQTETLSLQYENCEIISGLLIHQMDYYISHQNEINFLNDTYPHIPFVFDNKQYVIVIDGNVNIN
jgi:hypothetical protein